MGNTKSGKTPERLQERTDQNLLSDVDLIEQLDNANKIYNNIKYHDLKWKEKKSSIEQEFEKIKNKVEFMQKYLPIETAVDIGKMVLNAKGLSDKAKVIICEIIKEKYKV